MDHPIPEVTPTEPQPRTKKVNPPFFQYPISKTERMRIAVELEANIDSVEREMRGDRVSRVAGERIRKALKARGLPTSDGPSPAPAPVVTSKRGSK